MQTFRSTAKLTPEILAEYNNDSGKLLNAALTFLVTLPFACILFPVLLPYLQDSSIFPRRYQYIWLFAPLAVIGAGFHKYILPRIHRASLRSELRSYEKRFNTPTPTFESRIEDNAIFTRCLETGSEEHSLIHGKTVIQTEHYIFIRCSRSHLAIFAIADLSEEVLNDLLSTLSEYGAEIMPK